MFLAAAVAGSWGAFRAATRWKFPLLRVAIAPPFRTDGPQPCHCRNHSDSSREFHNQSFGSLCRTLEGAMAERSELLQFLTGTIGRNVGEPFPGTLHIMTTIPA